MAVQYNSDKGWSSWISLFKKQLEDVSEEANTFFQKMQEIGANLTSESMQSMIDNNVFDDYIKGQNLADESLIKFLKDTNYGTKDLANYQQYLKKTQGSLGNLSGALNKAKGVLKGFGAALGSMAINWAIGEIIGLAVKGIDEAIVTYDELNEQIEENRKAYEDTVQKIENLNSELETTGDRINELNSLDKLSVTEQEELNNLKEYNAELEKSVALEKLRQQNALKEQVSDTVEKYTESKYTKNSLSQLNQAREYEKRIEDLQGTLNRLEETYGAQADVMGISTEEYLRRYFGNDYIDWQAYEDNIERYQSLLSGLKSSNPSDEVLNEIEGLEKGIQVLKDYGLEDLSKSDYEAYEKMVKDLNDMYKTFFDDTTYAKVQIDPIFSSMESLEGVKDKLIEYFSNGGNFAGLREAFGDTVLKDLEEACKNLNVDYYDLLDFLYGDATQNYSSSNIADNILKEMFGEDAVEQYGASLIGSFKQSLVSEVNNMDVSTIPLLIDFINSDGEKYGSVEDFLGAFYDSINTSSPDADKTSILSLNETELEALDAYQGKLSLITKLRTEWADANASDKMDMMSSISKQFSDFDLSGLEGGKQTIEEVLSDLGFTALNTVKGQISNYSDELGNMLAEAFGKVNIIPYFEEVEKYQELLSEVQSGRIYDEVQIKAIIRDNEDLASAVKVVENGYKLEEDAVISLLNTSITAYNKQVSSARITTQDIIEARRKLIEAYGIEADLLKTISDLDLHGTSLEYLSDDDLKFDYGLTDEQIRAYREYSALVDSINLKYNKLYETIETDSGSASKSFEHINNSIEKQITNTGKVIKNLEKQNRELEKQKDTYDGILAAVQDVFKEKQDLIQSDIDGLNEQNDLLNDNINNYDLILSTVGDVYNTEIDAINAQKDAIDDKIEAMQEANDEAQKALALEKAQYELERARNQRVVKLYAGENKGFIYTQDEQAVKDAKENLENLEYEAAISALEKERDSLDSVIEELEKYKELWSDVVNAHERAKAVSLTKSLFGEDYALAILSTTVADIEDFANRYSSALEQIEVNESAIKNLESEIGRYEKLSEKWGEIAAAKEDSINRQNAAEKWGADWQAMILDGRLIDIENFKTEYTAIQDKIEDNQGLIDSYNEKVEYYNNLKDRWDEIVKNLEDNTEALNNFEENFSDVQERIAEDAGNTTRVIEETIAAYEKLLSIKGGSGVEDVSPTSNVAMPDSRETRTGNIDKALDIAIKSTPKFANGGVVGKKNENPLDYLARMADEDETVFVKKGDVIFAPAQQTELLQKFAGMANLVNPIMPNYTMPKYDFSAVTKVNNQKPVVQEINITLPNVTNESGYNNLVRTIQGLPLKAIQYANRR